jgi:glycosyltransferase involved in cell wall biosynthesis
MHILFVTGEYPPQEGGVGAYTSELGSALVDQGVQVSAVTSRAVDVQSKAPPDGIPVHNTITRWDTSVWSEIGRLAAEIQADWIHVQYQTAAFNMNPAINLAPERWRKSVGKPQVAWTYHDLLVPYLLPKIGDRARRWVTVRPGKKSDLTVVTNEGDRIQLRDQAIPNLHSIPIGSNIQGLQLDEEERTARRQLRGYCDDDRVLAYFGFLNRSKGGTTLIRALRLLVDQYPTAQLLMIGERVGASDPTNYAYLQEVEQLIDDLGLSDHVQWTGRQPDAEVGADLNACDALVMPYVDGASLRRGTLMAGLANGCAVVTTTPQMPLPELVDEREVLYVAPENDVALAKVVSRLLDSPWLAERLRANARKQSQLFTWASIARRHIDCYNMSEKPGAER